MVRKSRDEPWSLDLILRKCALEDATGCLVWRGAASSHGYGAVRIEGKTTRPHRAAYQFANDCIVPSSMDVCHRCDNRLCCNPAHLFVGTRADNMRDCANKGRIKVPANAGDACQNSKLTSIQVRAIRLDNRMQREIAATYGIDQTTVSDIKRGRTWRGA